MSPLHLALPVFGSTLSRRPALLQTDPYVVGDTAAGSAACATLPPTCGGTARLLYLLLSLSLGSMAWLGSTPALHGQAVPTRLNGQVISSTDGRPVEGVRVSLDAVPADKKPESTSETNPFGFFLLKDLAPGEYTLTAEHEHFELHQEKVVVEAGKSLSLNLQLTALHAEVMFDIYVQAWCLATHVPLKGAVVNLAYWKPDGDIGGPPDARFARVLDAVGFTSLVGMLNGFYTFQISKPGWDTLNYVPDPATGAVIVGDKIRLIRSHFASASLRPKKTTLDVTVSGFDPVKNKPGLPLKGVTLNLTGYDRALKRRTVPLIPGLTSEAGAHQFKNLGPFSLRHEDRSAATLLAHYVDSAGSSVRAYPINLAAPGDCNHNGIADREEIRAGLVEDCNGNGIPDLCDIASGILPDHNRNLLADGCEPAPPGDCNRNGIADRAELALGLGDQNKNGVLDDCESLLRVKLLNFTPGARERYYRAPGLRVRSTSAQSFEIEYSGALEQAPTVIGPWTAAE